MIIKLLDYTNDSHPNGNIQGKSVFKKIDNFILKNHLVDTFGISLEGIEATDASFPRESIIALAKQYRCQKFFYLTDMTDIDLIDNWSYGAVAKEQPLTIWSKYSYIIIGPKITEANRPLLEYILNNRAATTSQVANAFDITTQNASTRLKKMYTLGYLNRTEETAETGGKEFVYKAIK
ncbi:TPA: DNA-binding protein [Photobacterium damselae]